MPVKARQERPCRAVVSYMMLPGNWTRNCDDILCRCSALLSCECISNVPSARIKVPNLMAGRCWRSSEV